MPAPDCLPLVRLFNKASTCNAGTTSRTVATRISACTLQPVSVSCFALSVGVCFSVCLFLARALTAPRARRIHPWPHGPHAPTHFPLRKCAGTDTSRSPTAPPADGGVAGALDSCTDKAPWQPALRKLEWGVRWRAGRPRRGPWAGGPVDAEAGWASQRARSSRISGYGPRRLRRGRTDQAARVRSGLPISPWGGPRHGWLRKGRQHHGCSCTRWSRRSCYQLSPPGRLNGRQSGLGWSAP
jgi:hypothetical protein